MAFLDDLIKAGATFNEGIQAYQVGDSIRQATVQVNNLNDQLNQGVIKDMEARKQQQKLANDLAARLTQLGANSQQISQAFSALSPKQYGSAFEAAAAGDQAFADELSAFELEQKKKLLKATSQEEINEYWATTGRLELLKQGSLQTNKKLVPGYTLMDPTMDPKMAKANAGLLVQARAKKDTATEALTDYLDFIKGQNNYVERGKAGNWGIGEEGGLLQTKRTTATMALKEFLNLGVLQGLDKEEIDKMLGPDGFLSFSSTTEAVLGSLINSLDSQLDSKAKIFGFEADADIKTKELEGLKEAEKSKTSSPQAKTKKAVTIYNKAVYR